MLESELIIHSPLISFFPDRAKHIFAFHRWIRNPVLLACAGSVLFGLTVFGYRCTRSIFWTINASENDLPMGLPNPRNLCYLNALLQAMSTNASLVRFLKRSARIRRSKLLYCLVCILKGLRCSNEYIRVHNLDTVLREAHTMLLNELTNAQSWSTEEQQDAHELFGFFMDVACCREFGRTACKANEGLTSVSGFIGPRYEHVVPRSFHRARVNDVQNVFTLHAPLRLEVFQQHLLVNQVTCRSCDYRSSPVLQPEACLTVFFDSASHSTVAPFRDRLGNRRAPRLSECLSKQFGTSEPLPDLHCPNCQTSTRHPRDSLGHCQQERWIAHLPSCLVLHVQRSAWLRRPGISWNPFGFGSKRQDYVYFPYQMNMARYMLSSRSTVVSDTSHRRDSGDVCKQSALSQVHARQPRTYVLRAVLVHQGESINSGHYVTYRTWRKRNPNNLTREPVYLRFLRSVTTTVSNFFHGIPSRSVKSSSPWIFTSDKHVLRVSSDEVRSSLAYLLFYERDTHASVYEACTFENGCGPQTHGRRTSGSFTEADSKEADWDSAAPTDRYAISVEDTDDEADPDDVEVEESDETSDTGDEFAGWSKAEVIRAFALAASQS